MGDQIAEQRRDGDRREAVRRVAADDQFEAVEGAGERRTERAGDSAGGAAANQDAQIGAAQPKCDADAGGNAAGQLGIAGLDADRSTDPARPDGLQRDDHAAEKRHASAVQRIRLDRIDLAIRPPSRDQFTGDAEHDAAGERHRNRDERIELQQSRQPHAGFEAKNTRCSRSTPAPIAATTSPAIAPTSAASAIRLDSRARTKARRRRGISNRLVDSIDQDRLPLPSPKQRPLYWNRANFGLFTQRTGRHYRSADAVPPTAAAACRLRLCGHAAAAETARTASGQGAFGDWHSDSPGTRLIRPQDLPAPDPGSA